MDGHSVTNQGIIASNIYYTPSDLLNSELFKNNFKKIFTVTIRKKTSLTLNQVIFGKKAALEMKTFRRFSKNGANPVMVSCRSKILYPILPFL